MRPLIFVVLDTTAARLGLNCQEKAVLLALVSHLNAKRNGSEVWPSVERLAGLAGVSERTVQRAVQHLGELGYVKTRSESGKSNVYTIISGALQAATDPRQCDGGPVDNSADPRQADTPTPVRESPHPRQGVTLTAKEQPNRTTEPISSFGCSANPIVSGGAQQRKLTVHGVIAEATELMRINAHEQPTIDKPKEGTGCR